MKRKDIRKTICDVAELTTQVDGTVEIVNKRTGDRYALDMTVTLAIVRGVLAWCDGLLDYGGVPVLSTKDQLHELLVYVGDSTVLLLSDEEC